MEVPSPTATAQASLAPTLSPTPTATPEPKTMYVVAEAGLWLRAGPGPDAARLDLLRLGSVVLVTGSSVQNSGYAWVPVHVGDGQTGWVATGDTNGTYLSELAPVAPTEGSTSWALSGSGGLSAPLQDPTTWGGRLYGQEVPEGLHPGVDLHSSDDTVRSNAAGKVFLYQTWQDDGGWHVEPYDPGRDVNLAGFGNYAVLETDIAGDTYYQVFAHFDGFDSGIVQGQHVEPGTSLGTMDCTGNCDGAHVHWEIRREDAVDPTRNHSLGSMHYPGSVEELNSLFVDPNTFGEWLQDPGPRRSVTEKSHESQPGAPCCDHHRRHYRVPNHPMARAPH